MRAPELAIIYVLIGVGSTVALALYARTIKPRWVDAMIMVPFWPLYGPFLLMRLSETGGVEANMGPWSALGGSLAGLLPDPSMISALNERIRQAKQRITEIDLLLSRPEFCETAALERHLELQAKGDRRSAEKVQARLQNIRRLRKLRDRFSRELTEVTELLTQLEVQSEVLRLAGPTKEATGEIVAEVMARIEGLDAILASESDLDDNL